MTAYDKLCDKNMITTMALYIREMLSVANFDLT